MAVEAGAQGGPTIWQDRLVRKAIVLSENSSILYQDWRTVQDEVFRTLRRTRPSVLKVFDIGFRLEHGVLDDHLEPVYVPRSVVDRLADLG